MHNWCTARHTPYRRRKQIEGARSQKAQLRSALWSVYVHDIFKKINIFSSPKYLCKLICALVFVLSWAQGIHNTKFDSVLWLSLIFTCFQLLIIYFLHPWCVTVAAKKVKKKQHSNKTEIKPPLDKHAISSLLPFYCSAWFRTRSTHFSCTTSCYKHSRRGRLYQLRRCLFFFLLLKVIWSLSLFDWTEHTRAWRRKVSNWNYLVAHFLSIILCRSYTFSYQCYPQLVSSALVPRNQNLFMKMFLTWDYLLGENSKRTTNVSGLYDLLNCEYEYNKLQCNSNSNKYTTRADFQLSANL